MTVYFFDSSVLTKRYIVETGSNWVLNTVAINNRHQILIAQITSVEVFRLFHGISEKIESRRGHPVLFGCT